MKNKIADTPYGGLNADKIKSANPKFHPEHKQMFMQFVRDRYNVHLNKDFYKTEKPWTDNPILLDYKFTNVRREHDKTTQHLIRNIVNVSMPYNNKLLNIILYRLFNKVETFDAMGGCIDFKTINSAQSAIGRLKNLPSDTIFFTNAFYTTGMRQGMKRTIPEEDFEPARIIKCIWLYRNNLLTSIRKAQTPKQVIDAVKILDGVGDFLGYQMFVDFTYLNEFPWSENEFVVAGPGCISGLSELFEDRDGLSYDELLFWLRDNCPITQDECMELMKDLPTEDRFMNIMSLENCMCELSKYIRACEKTGRPKNKYNGRT